MPKNDQARPWLRENGYDDVANIIDEIIQEWESQGKKTRRNWWVILAGDKDGNPREVAGRAFPVLKTAQVRQGIKPTKNAISRSKKEKKQAIWSSTRWSSEAKEEIED